MGRRTGDTPNYGGKDSLYEVLGVYRSSSADDIERAYRRLRAECERDAAPPEQLALVREAHEVLSDPARRAAYDASMRSSEFLRPERPKRRGGSRWLPIGIGVLVVAAGAAFFLFPRGEAGLTRAQLQAAISPAVGRVHSIDVSGRATPRGNAFAIAEGVMVTSCEGLRPGSAVVVKFGTRTASARVEKADAARDVCRLAVVAAGSWPLRLATGRLAEDAKVYAVSTSPEAEAFFREARVEALVSTEGGTLARLSTPVTADESGGPVLDMQGRVVGMMTNAGSWAGRNVSIPTAWIEPPR